MKLNKMLLTVLVGMMLLTAVSFGMDFKYGGAYRFRTSTHFLGDAADSDQAIMQHYIDQRFRMKFYIEASEMLSGTVQFEMGDFRWGSNTDFGTDEKAVEVKHAYIDFKLGDWKFRPGMQGLADNVDGFLFDDDAPGLSAMYTKGNIGLTLAYIVDQNETNIKDHNLGKDYFWAQGNLKPNKDINLGFDLMYGSDNSEESSTHVSEHTHIVVGLGYDAQFGKLASNGGFAYTSYNMDMIGINGADDGDSYDGSGMGIFTKNTFAMNDNTSIGVNLLYVGGDKEGADVFSPVSPYFSTGLEILGNGVNDGYNRAGLLFSSYGSMLAVLHGSSAVTSKISVNGAFGYAMYADKDEDALGMEIDLGAAVKIVDGLKLKAVFAYFMPGDGIGEDLESNYALSTCLQWKPKFSFAEKK